MAIWIKLPSVAMTNGSNTVSVSGSVDLSAVKAGWALIINGNYVEIASGTAADSSGKSTITLASAWDGSAITGQPAQIQPTGAPFLEGIAALEATNEYAIDVHNALAESATEDKDVTIKDPTGTEHTFASMPKNARLVKELIDNGNSELSEIVQDVKSQLEQTAMSKAEFFALAEQRKRNYAGSGFVEWGKHANSNDWTSINSGLWSFNGSSENRINSLSIGRPNGEGVSRTDYPITLVNGVQHKIYSVYASGSSDLGQIKFPEAEQGTRSYDSETGEVIDYLTDIDPKYGDVATDLNEAVARNFEGLVRNGDFRDGIDKWQVSQGVLSAEEESVSFVAAPGDSTNCFMYQTPQDFNGGGEYEYTIEVDFNGVSATEEGTIQIDSIDIPVPNDAAGKQRLEGTITLADSSGTNQIRIRNRDITNNTPIKIYSVNIRKTTNQPILSRQDYCFLETWHEKVSTKDIFCPLGNVQYGNADSEEGIDLVDVTTLDVGQGYSAFGEWDSSTIGKAAKWSTLTTTQQKACLDNPDNNLYYDSEAGELIQVRYRVRVVKGKGNKWFRTRPLSNGALQYDTKTKATYVLFRGSSDTSDLLDLGTLSSRYLFTSEHTNSQIPNDIGAFSTIAGSPYAHGGLGYGTPICIAQRGNQGAYHPVYNPDGYAAFFESNGSNSWKMPWYSKKAKVPNMAYDCFKSGATPTVGNVAPFFKYQENGLYNTGTILYASTGRSDQYKYYDAIYAGQVQDLRLNANKQDPNRLMEDAIRSAVAGETRGVGKQVFSTVYSDAGSGISSSSDMLWRLTSAGNLYIYANFKTKNVAVGDWAIIYDATDEIIVRFKIGEVNEDQWIRLESASSDPLKYHVLLGNVSPGYDATANEVYYIIEKELTAQYNSIPQVDIIGTPENIMATFPDGVVGQWIPNIPDGTGKTYSLNKKCTRSIGRAYSSDGGSTFYFTNTAIVDLVTNSVTSNWDDTYILMYYYETLSDFTEPDENRVIYGADKRVGCASRHEVNKGNRLITSLINKISKDTYGGNYFQELSLTKVPTAGGKFFDNAVSSIRSPIHSDLTLGASTNNSPAIKSLYHLVEKDGLLYMQYHGRELKHDGTDWGDDNTVPIVDNESTMLDDNGNTVKTFTHTELFPIGIADYTQTK